jgi:hypothetical protein
VRGMAARGKSVYQRPLSEVEERGKIGPTQKQEAQRLETLSLRVRLRVAARPRLCVHRVGAERTMRVPKGSTCRYGARSPSVHPKLATGRREHG